MKGYDPSYLDHLSAVLQRVFVDLGVLRRRQKHQGARYAQWVERLLQMVVTDGDGTEDTTAELTDSKVEKLVFMTNYYNAQADRNNAQADRKIILQESPGKNRGGKFFSVYRRFRLLGRWRRQAWPQRDFFPPDLSVVPDPPEEYRNLEPTTTREKILLRGRFRRRQQPIYQKLEHNWLPP